MAPSVTIGAVIPVAPERRDEGCDVPMAVRHFADQPLAFQSAAARSGHVRADAGFIDEDQVFGIKRCLAVTPDDACRSDVRTILFGGVLSFF
jgi:hypothetical protein